MPEGHTKTDIGALLNVHRYTITRWVQKRLFPAPDAGNMYKKETIMAWIKDHWAPGLCQCHNETCGPENQEVNHA